MLEELKQEIGKFGWRNGIFKPHKHIALLSAFEVLSADGFSNPNICFSARFKDEFSKFFNTHFSNTKNSCRPHTPFFHLQSSSFWKLIPREGMSQKLEDATTVGGPGALEELVEYAEISDSLLGALRNEEQRNELVVFVENCLIDDVPTVNKATFRKKSPPFFDIIPSQNSFVPYLNSLQRIGGRNENALAESQACNAQFATIHVAQPLSAIIFDELNSPNGYHVILTGHAGDGKSTLALEVFKKISRIPADRPLNTPMAAREDVQDVSIIKDLSERDKHEDKDLITELADMQRRFLLVTNTGTLLDLIKNHSDHFDGDEITMESKVLDAISAASGESILVLNSVKFRVFNLARMDNLNLARQIFCKMLATDRWKVCQGKTCQSWCPIYANVTMIQQDQELIVDRLFLAYRRMYEYGTRLTMRQFTEHLSYMITSGLDYSDLQKIAQKQQQQPLLIEYLFFNRFFGDNGDSVDSEAQQMKAIREVVAQGFGERPSSNWEHRLWLQTAVQPVEFGIDDCNEIFKKLRTYGAKATSGGGMRSVQAREQVRRMLYFLYDFKDQEKEYLGQYLNSPTLLLWQDWQQSDAQLSSADKAMLVQKIYHVLQEHLTGVRLPEGATQQDRRLYVTLSRRSSEVRQSAQVVLAEVDWRTAIELKLSRYRNATSEIRYDLVLYGKDRIKGVDLVLKVPFLDYVIMRHFGELGEVLQASYLERLERFKAEVQKRAADSGDDGVTLVRLKTDHTFRRQYYTVNNGRLEVNDAL